LFILGHFLAALAMVLDSVLWLYYWVIIIHALLSWFSPDPWNPVVRTLDSLCRPILRPIRRVLPQTALDFSPLVAVLAVYFLRDFLVRSLLDLSVRLGG